MNIKRLFEKTNTGFKEFVAKVDFANVIGLSEELSKYIKKDSNNYVATINPDINIDDEVPKITYVDGAGGINDIYLDLASEDGPGLMTRDDKIKLNNLPNLSNPNILTDIGAYGRSNSFIDLVYKSTSTQTPYPKIRVEAATTTYAGVMTADDKAKLDSIPVKYIPTFDGVINESMTFNKPITFNEDIYFNKDIYITGNIYGENPEEGVRFNGCNGIQHFNQYEAIKSKLWNAQGGTIDISEILINAAIYVQGSMTIAAGSLNRHNVLESPDSIIFDTFTGTFYAYDRNNDKFYTSWSANLQNNIYPPEKYGAVINNIVHPLPKQMYRFEGNNNIYICSYPSRIARMTILKIE